MTWASDFGAFIGFPRPTSGKPGERLRGSEPTHGVRGDGEIGGDSELLTCQKKMDFFGEMGEGFFQVAI